MGGVSSSAAAQPGRIADGQPLGVRIGMLRRLKAKADQLHRQPGPPIPVGGRDEASAGTQQAGRRRVARAADERLTLDDVMDEIVRDVVESVPGARSLCEALRLMPRRNSSARELHELLLASSKTDVGPATTVVCVSGSTGFAELVDALGQSLGEDVRAFFCIRQLSGLPVSGTTNDGLVQSVGAAVLHVVPYDAPLVLGDARAVADARVAAVNKLSLRIATSFEERHRLVAAIARGEIVRLERTWHALVLGADGTLGGAATRGIGGAPVAGGGGSKLRAALREWLLATAVHALPAESLAGAPSDARAARARLLHEHGAHDVAFADLVRELRARADAYGMSESGRHACLGAAKAGRLERAIEEEQASALRALASDVRVRTVQLDSVNVLAIAHNLGAVVKALGAGDAALKLYSWATEGREALLGSYHISALVSRANRAVLDDDLRFRDAAEREYRTVLERLPRATAAADEAAAARREALRTAGVRPDSADAAVMEEAERAAGDDSARARELEATCSAALATILERKRNAASVAEAVALRERVLEARIMAGGGGDDGEARPVALDAANRLALSLRRAGDARGGADAEAVYRRALRACRAVAAARERGFVRCEGGALPLEARALDIASNLAQLLGRRIDRGGAHVTPALLSEVEGLHRAALEGRSALLGLRAEPTARSARLLANHLDTRATGRAQEAADAYWKALEANSAVFGFADPRVLRIAAALARTLRKLGREDEAAAVARSTLAELRAARLGAAAKRGADTRGSGGQAAARLEAALNEATGLTADGEEKPADEKGAESAPSHVERLLALEKVLKQSDAAGGPGSPERAPSRLALSSSEKRAAAARHAQRAREGEESGELLELPGGAQTPPPRESAANGSPVGSAISTPR